MKLAVDGKAQSEFDNGILCSDEPIGRCWWKIIGAFISHS